MAAAAGEEPRYGGEQDVRFYDKKFPDLEEIVLCTVRRIEHQVGVYVTLPEYGDIEGMIQIIELSRTRIRSLQQVVRIGKNVHAVAHKVDPVRGYVDLSRRRVIKAEIPAFEEKLAKARTVHSIMRTIAMHTKQPLAAVCEKISWPLYAKGQPAYDSFMKIVVDDDFSDFEGLQITSEEKELLIATARRKLTPQAMRIRAEVDVVCHSYAGVTGIQRALVAGQEAAEKVQIEGLAEPEKFEVKLIAPPTFILCTQTTVKDVGMRRMETCMKAIEDAIKAEGGKSSIAVFDGRLGQFNVTKKPEVFGLEEETKVNSDVSESEDDDEEEEEEDETMGHVDIDEAALARR